ncbi:ras-like protein family member 10B [Centruroides sculpturatus]|uniref:ras-like protein family member 10B n=1 Tax=Centruroides sculpturatus TaxID=218467 RepID=UPI000C6E2BE0|nr:ras-like protein family member 10B [Centruroides sculpturatus]XP_023243641.1 ras-like protein family member 10B [Centruroides sculpturatus]
MQRVKLIVLGAAAVGKTSIINQFVWNEYTEDYSPTEMKQTFYPTVYINEHLYELMIIDLPVISYFPSNTYYEWSEFQSWGLRSASAYVLVFDLNVPETFQYVKFIRDQIFDSRNMHNIPVFVVGNKHDLCETRDRRDIATLVKKHWKCGYVECSAKYNWHIVLLFKEVMRILDNLDSTYKPSSGASRFDGLQGSLHNNKCIIL